MNFNEDDLRTASKQVSREWELSIEKAYGHLPEHQFSKRFERRMKRLICEGSRTRGQRKLLDITKKVAAVFAVIFMSAVIATVSVSAYREQFIKYIAKLTHRSTDYDFIIATEDYYTADLSETVYGYVPEGFEKIGEIYNSDVFCQTEFRKDEENFYFLEFTVLTKDSATGISVDTENSEMIERTIDGEDAIINLKNGYCTLIWHRANVLCQLYGKIDSAEAVKIAENIEVVLLDGME